MKVVILFCFITVFMTTAAIYDDNQYSYPIEWWHTDDNAEYTQQPDKRIPFPDCLVSRSKSRMYDSSSIERLLNKQLRKEENDLKQERYENDEHDNGGMMDYGKTESRNGYTESRATARAGVTVAGDVLTALLCDLDGTDSASLDNLLSKFKMPEQLCSYRKQVDCTNKTTYRTADGVCNNLKNPYRGSAQTAFGRILPADYDDHLSKPKRKSRAGGLLPPCRHISLELGSQPIFDRNYNNFFVIFGQIIGHDISLSTPVSDTYSTPISSCKCGSKYDWNKCNVIDIRPDDPYLGGQKCMAFPATAQAFKNQVCSLGVKEQMNGNTQMPDLSIIYGSNDKIAQNLRGPNGSLKSSRLNAYKHEFPPAQREGKSCSDETQKQKCLAGGDSRLMINLLFTGIEAMFLRFHNQIAAVLGKANPTWTSDQIYQETRKYTVAYFQTLVYYEWLPILLGETEYAHLCEFISGPYDETVQPVVYNELATAAFRHHTLVRDLFSRCTPDGKRIDQVWLHDIMHKSKYVYDVKNNGLDSILCGSLYDYGFAFDGNFAQQLQNRLFETTNKEGKKWRNDLIAINICRGREHGLPSYNDLREYCKFPKAYYFEDFGDTINYDGIQKLKKLYKHVDDVELFPALQFEDRVEGGLVGPVTACLTIEQFRVLAVGDRFFVPYLDFTHEQRLELTGYTLACFVCNTVDILEVPKNPFRPPDSIKNPLISCALSCPPIASYPVLSAPSTLSTDTGRAPTNVLPSARCSDIRAIREAAKDKLVAAPVDSNDDMADYENSAYGDAGDGYRTVDDDMYSSGNNMRPSGNGMRAPRDSASQK